VFCIIKLINFKLIINPIPAPVLPTGEGGGGERKKIIDFLTRPGLVHEARPHKKN